LISHSAKLVLYHQGRKRKFQLLGIWDKLVLQPRNELIKKDKMKVTIVGAGAVGASCAEYIAIKNFASEVVLVDIKEGYAEGKAMDLMQCASLNGFDTKLTGSTNDYSKSAGSHVAVITSGIPRKPGMTREELIGINAGIVKEVVGNILKHSPNAIIIVVSNPMDTMAYLAHKVAGIAKNRIIGMGGALDSARFKYRLAEALECPQSDVDGMVIGGHSDVGMVPLIGRAVRNSIPVSKFLSDERMSQIVEDTKVGGATLTGLLGTSAWYAPGAAVSALVQAIGCDQKKMFPCSALVEGEFGLNDLCIGVPCVIGKNGIERIVELDLTDAEKAKMIESADGVKKTNDLLSSVLG
jgi:malate dehydrogenase